MPKRYYGVAETLDMLRAYGSLIEARQKLIGGVSLSLRGPNQFTRDKIARKILYELIPEYRKTVPEEIQSQLPIDIKSLEERCKRAII